MHLKLVVSTFVVLISLSIKPSAAATNVVLCYYESGAEEEFPTTEIDLNICTHINYSFLGINPDGTLRLNGGDDLFLRLADLKNQKPNLKLIFSVGGWGEDPTGFSNVAADSEKLATMADSALWYLQTYNFDGIDIDWEYPGERGGTPVDRENFVTMLTTLRNKFDENGGYLLTAAVCSDPDCGEYNVGGISSVVDYVNVMTYDMHSVSDGKTGQNSALYASSTDTAWEKDHANCDAAINNWINRGAAPDKLVLGLGFYGKSYTLSDPDNHGVGAPISGEGEEAAGSYDHICTLVDGWTEEWDDEQQNPYKYSGSNWIGYDNPRSIGLKVQYAKSRNLGGVMMWSVNLDNKEGSCGTKHALLQAIKDNL